MKEVKIKIPKGYVIDKENSSFECIKFKKIEEKEKENKRKELPKTWEEFCDNYPIKRGEFFVDATCRIYENVEGQRDPAVDANILPNKKYAEAMIALCQLIQLRDCYNEGWQPDWKTFEAKYCICIEQNIVQLKMGYRISCLLAFKTQKIRDEFCINFRDIIEQAKILL